MKLKEDDNKEEIQKILKSKNFTILYHDNGSAALFSKKYSEDEKFELDWDNPEEGVDVYEITDGSNNYLPYLLEIMTEILEGSALSY